MTTLTASHLVLRTDLRGAVATRSEAWVLNAIDRVGMRLEQRIARRSEAMVNSVTPSQRARQGRSQHLADAHALGLLRW